MYGESTSQIVQSSEWQPLNGIHWPDMFIQKNIKSRVIYSSMNVNFNVYDGIKYHTFNPPNVHT